MPVIKIDTWPKPAEKKKQMIEGITKVFTDMGVAKEHITIVVTEVPKENWALAGEYQGEE
ncbi:TPA: 4-oxalocrotonate tautomerase [Candidatus Woesearchaeota archaeon]|nr:4-oxalocrotonate tautomerase [Candidatus Woesearchaeota archaeon]HII69493.1 4-oxalocrotonate tautomerase [Candidatus Woesearchaeota archaeon]